MMVMGKERVLFFAFFLLLYEKAIPQFVRHLGRKKIWIPDTKTFSAPLLKMYLNLPICQLQG